MKTKLIKISTIEKLSLINDTYSNCFVNEPHLFNMLRKEDGSERINNHILYDIIDTMMNTWCSIDYLKEVLGSNLSKGGYMIHIHGFFQCIYVHQDLMDELYWIFKLSNDKSSNLRKESRDIRNESVGHPINIEIEDEKGKQLISTIVWCWQNKSSPFSKIEYLYREKGEIKNQQKKSFMLNKVIDEHEEYIDFCLNEILRVLIEHLENHMNNKQMKAVELLNDNISNPEKLNIVARLIASEDIGSFRAWNEYHGYYSYNNLKKAIYKMNSGLRYKHFVENYFAEIKNLIVDNGAYISAYNDILNALNGHKVVFDNSDVEIPKIVIIKSSEKDFDENKLSLKQKTSYYISKLFESKYYSDIKTMKAILLDYPEMIIELNHMDEHWIGNKQVYRNEEHFDRKDEMEYFSALLYLEELIEVINNSQNPSSNTLVN